MNIKLHSSELKNLRESLGISQSNLAKITGINRSYISQFESGKRLLSDFEVETITEFLSENGADLEVDSQSHSNDVTERQPVRQKDGFILPIEFDEGLAEDILTQIYERTANLESLLTKKIPETGLFANPQRADDEELAKYNQIVLEELATCFLLVLKLRGEDSFINLLTDAVDPVAVGTNVYDNSQIINREELLNL